VFYGLVVLGTVGGTVLSLAHLNPIKLLVLVAVINGVAAAPFLIVVMCVSSNRRLMGDRVNGRAAQIVGWTTAGVMAVARWPCSPPEASACDAAVRRRQPVTPQLGGVSL
jgi:Mn2+/Fe2+ NRAMP family transporter